MRASIRVNQLGVWKIWIPDSLFSIRPNQLVLLNFKLPNEMFKCQKRFRERGNVKYFGKPVCLRRFAVSRFGFHFSFKKKPLYLKSDIALIQTLSQIFHLIQCLQFVKCWRIFLELNSKRLYQSSEEEKEKCCLVFTSSTRRKIR